MNRRELLLGSLAVAVAAPVAALAGPIAPTLTIADIVRSEIFLPYISNADWWAEVQERYNGFGYRLGAEKYGPYNWGRT